MNARVAVILNPRSFRVPFLKARLRRALQFLRAHSQRVVLYTLAPGQPGRDLALHAVQQGADLLVAAGGDGTFREVATAGWKTGVPVGLLPLGATNVLTFELGLPRNLLQAAGVILKGRTRPLDLGLANGEVFVLMMGVGFDAFVVHSLITSAKRALGPQGYVITGLLRAPQYRYPRFVVHPVDPPGETITGYQAVLSNCRFYGGRFWFSPTARPDDGRLDLTVIQHAGLPRFALYALAVVTHRVHQMPGVIHRQGTRFQLEGPSVPYHLDSEPVGTLPAEVRVLPRALRVLAP